MIFGTDTLQNLLNGKILYSETLGCFLRLNIVLNRIEFKVKLNEEWLISGITFNYLLTLDLKVENEKEMHNEN